MVNPESANYYRTLLYGIFFGICILVLAVFLPVIAHTLGAEWGHLSYLAFGDLCHQQIDRSFQIGGIPLAVCARCLGIYIGIWSGMLWSLSTENITAGFKENALQLLFLFILLNILQYGVEYTTGFLSTNSVRFAVGILPGATLSVYIVQSTLNDHIKLFDYATKPAK